MERVPKFNDIFPKPSIDDWVAKIEKDLKGKKSAQELQYYIENSLSIDTIQAYQPIDLNPIHREGNHLVACHIDTSKPNCNETIQNLLNVGVNTLILDAYSGVDYNVILKDVILDYIHLIVYPMDNNAEHDVLSYLEHNNADMDKVYSPSSAQNLIHIPFQGSVSTQLSQLLQAVSESEASNLVLVLDGQKDFLTEVAKIRAAHILLSNLNVALDNKTNYKLLSHTKANKESKIHELIQSTFMGLAAVIGEADGIVSTALDDRFDLNGIHTYNLLTMESGIGPVNDPASGSDLIEKMTEVICQESWKSFVSNH